MMHVALVSHALVNPSYKNRSCQYSGCVGSVARTSGVALRGQGLITEQLLVAGFGVLAVLDKEASWSACFPSGQRRLRWLFTILPQKKHRSSPKGPNAAEIVFEGPPFHL